MIKKLIKNQSGLSIVELMVAAVIAIIVLGGSIYVFTTQQSLLKDENDSTKVRAKGRLAIKLLAREIRMAGFGMPPGKGITNLNSPPNSIIYRSNVDDVRTYMDASGTGAVSTDDTITVMSTVGFAQFDNVIVYNPAYNDSSDLIVDSITTNTIVFTADLGVDYTFGQNARVIYVNKYNEITLKLNGNRITKQWDADSVTTSAETTIINNIAASGLEFDYYDRSGNVTTDPALVRRVGITLNMLDPDNEDAVIEFKTDVDVRNATPQT